MRHDDGELIRLDALGATGEYRARNSLPLCDVAGVPTAELSLVPPLFVSRSIAALGRSTPLPMAQRAAAMAAAGAAFTGDTVASLSAEEYQRAVSRVSGLPVTVVRAASRYLATAARGVTERLGCALPHGAVMDWREPDSRGGSAVWTRRGEVFAVLAAGNHPAVHGPWLEALALGYRVAVRPSRREPFTPHRLVSALRAAGFGADQLVLLPTDHRAADELIASADLSMVYGGEDVVSRYADDPSVLPQGPGRSKILLTAGDDWRDHLDTVVDSISQEAGTACTNATAVFVEGDPAPVAKAIAARLAELPSLPPEHEDAVLPVQPVAVAKEIESQVLRHARGCVAWLGGDGVLRELGDGSAVLRPAVFQVDSSTAPQAGVELPFPCVWVAPWQRQDGTGPLLSSLVLTISTEDDELVEALLLEPSIGNVYIGNQRTVQLGPRLPHDGYLGEFLMRCKAVVRPETR